MRHMDDGQLQSWLDGARGGLPPEERAEVAAHLERCADCSRRLEALREEGAEAEELLALVQDDEAIPDFGAVVARAQELRDETGGSVGGAARGPTPSGSEAAPVVPTAPRRGFRPSTLSWAASVVVALGVGWMANEVAQGPGRELLRPDPSAAIGGAQDDAGFSAGEGGPVVDEVARDARDQGTVAGGTAAADAAAPAGEAVLQDAGLAPVPEVAADEGAPSDREQAAMPEPTTVVAQPTAGERVEVAEEVGRRRAETEARRRAEEEARPRAVVERMQQAPPPTVTSSEPAAAADAEPQTAAVPSDGRFRVVGQVTDAVSGRPLASVQVMVPGTGLGALTNEEGRYMILADRLRERADLGQLTAQAVLIGYGTDSVRLSPEAAGVASADFRLRQTVLQLDELVVTGVAEDAPRRALASVTGPAENLPEWRPVDLSNTEAIMGFEPRMLPEFAVVENAIGQVEGTPVLRTLQRDADGFEVTLYQAATSFTLAPPADEVVTAVSREGDVHLVAHARTSPDALEELLRRIR